MICQTNHMHTCPGRTPALAGGARECRRVQVRPDGAIPNPVTEIASPTRVLSLGARKDEATKSSVYPQ